MSKTMNYFGISLEYANIRVFVLIVEEIVS